MIIFIPTKGRPQTKTYKLFEDSGFEVYHFIEPHEIKLYSVPNMIDIGAIDMGMSFVRNFMLDFARSKGIEFVCVCDDDITEFGVASNGKSKKMKAASALIKPFEIFKKSDFAIGGINQRQFAWSESKRYRVNTGKCESFIMQNIKKINWNYFKSGKQDKDFIMQCLDNRRNFIYFAMTFFNAPAIGSNKGGCHSYYKHGKDKSDSFNLSKRWLGYSKIKKQYGRVDVKFDYKKKATDMGLKVI